MARLLKKPLVIALAAVILLVIGFFAYIQNAFTGTRCEAAKHLDADMIGDCYGCHLKVTPQVAQDWYESKHGVTAWSAVRSATASRTARALSRSSASPAWKSARPATASPSTR